MIIVSVPNSAINARCLKAQDEGFEAFGCGPWGNSRRVMFFRFSHPDGRERMIVGSKKRVVRDTVYSKDGDALDMLKP